MHVFLGVTFFLRFRRIVLFSILGAQYGQCPRQIGQCLAHQSWGLLEPVGNLGGLLRVASDIVQMAVRYEGLIGALAQISHSILEYDSVTREDKILLFATMWVA